MMGGGGVTLENERYLFELSACCVPLMFWMWSYLFSYIMHGRRAGIHLFSAETKWRASLITDGNSTSYILTVPLASYLPQAYSTWQAALERKRSSKLDESTSSLKILVLYDTGIVSIAVRLQHFITQT
jgi:hypothetical protein